MSILVTKNTVIQLLTDIISAPYISATRPDTVENVMMMKLLERSAKTREKRISQL